MKWYSYYGQGSQILTHRESITYWLYDYRFGCWLFSEPNWFYITWTYFSTLDDLTLVMRISCGGRWCDHHSLRFVKLEDFFCKSPQLDSSGIFLLEYMDLSSASLGDRGCYLMRDRTQVTFYVIGRFYLLLWVSTTLVTLLLLFLCRYLVAVTDCMFLWL